MVERSVPEYHGDKDVKSLLQFSRFLRLLTKGEGGVDFDGEIRGQGDVAATRSIRPGSLVGDHVVVVDHHRNVDSLGQKRILAAGRPMKNFLLKRPIWSVGLRFSVVVVVAVVVVVVV